MDKSKVWTTLWCLMRLTCLHRTWTFSAGIPLFFTSGFSPLPPLGWPVMQHQCNLLRTNKLCVCVCVGRHGETVQFAWHDDRWRKPSTMGDGSRECQRRPTRQRPDRCCGPAVINRGTMFGMGTRPAFAPAHSATACLWYSAMLFVGRVRTPSEIEHGVCIMTSVTITI